MRFRYRLLRSILAVLPVLLVPAVQATVVPPLSVTLEVLQDGGDGRYDAEIAVVIPAAGATREAVVELRLRADGVAAASRDASWAIRDPRPGEVYRFPVQIDTVGAGEGSTHVQAVSYDRDGHRLWGRAASLFFLATPDERLHGRSSVFELKREKLRRDLARGVLTARDHRAAERALLDGKALYFEDGAERLRSGLDAGDASHARPVAKAVTETTVSGVMRYTHRIGRTGTTDVFAAAADALPIRRARVEFFHQAGTTTTPLTSTPAVVTTGEDGRYSATVPGMVGADPVNLVVRLSATNPAVRVGPVGQRTLVHTKSSAPAVVTATTTTVDILADSTDLLALRAFAIQEGMLTSFDFVVGNNAATGVGAAPVQIFVEFPGSNPNGSFFSTSPDDHLNIGQGHAFDWDVYTHEYGHYIQKINNTSQSPGGCHFITANNTGFNQASGGCGGPPRVLTKQQAIRLAWGEGWPTFFGTNLQIGSNAGALGIFGVADTRYTDSANGFAYDLEGNAESFRAGGEDNELSVQRILWDFADALRDGHDELAHGTNEMWRQLVGDSSVVTLEAFRAKLDGLLPTSPAGYDTGTAEQNRAKQGRIYFDLEVGPEPLTPADNAPIGATAPEFKWKNKGAKSGAIASTGYRFNRFNVLFFTADYGQLLFTSPDITTTGTAAEATWTPTAAEWATITGATGTPLNGAVKWVVQGQHDLVTPATGPYRGIDRTLGAIDFAFVIDDTGSMFEEIGGVRTGLTQLLAGLSGMELIDFFTFKDDVTNRILSDDQAAVQAVVDALVATGGGDCPESSAEALLEAGQLLSSGNSIVFATDASPHAGFDLAAIRTELASRGITFTALVTADCVFRDGAPGSVAAAATDDANRDPGYAPLPRRPTVPDVFYDVTCPSCPPDPSVGPSLSSNALALIGDSSLETPSSIVAFQSLAAASPRSHFLYLPGVNAGDPEPFANAVANAALAAVSPTVIAVQPGDLVRGATMDVTIAAGSTNFLTGSEPTFEGTGVQVESWQVVSPTELLVRVRVDPSAPLGARDVTVRTPLGGGVVETARGAGQARVVDSGGAPRLVSVRPRLVGRGNRLDLVIRGVGTSFSSVTDISIPELTVHGIEVLDARTLRVDVSVPEMAALGFRTIEVTTGPATARLGAQLSVIDPGSLGSGGAVLSAVTPERGARGTTMNVTLLGEGTSFLEGVSTASFGVGIDVLSTVVASPSEAIAEIVVTADAPLGFRDVQVVTGGEVAVRLNGFLVEDGAVAIDIPSLDSLGLALLALLLASVGAWALGRRRG